MLSYFDPKTKFLVLGTRPLDKVADTYVDSDQYRSYKKYLDQGIIRDVQEVLIPALNDIFKDKHLEFRYHDDMVSIQKGTDFAKHAMYNVKLALMEGNATNVFEAGDGTKKFFIKDRVFNPFVLLEMPYMDRSGVLYRRGKAYSVINLLALDDTLTFDGTKLRFVDSGHSLEIGKPSKPKVKMFGDSISVFDFVIMLAKRFYGSSVGSEYSKAFIKSVRNSTLISTVSGSEKDYQMCGDDAFDFNLDTMVGPKNDDIAIDFRLEAKFETGCFGASSTREFLNELFSFRNAKGKTISRDIVTSDGRTIAKEGETVTDVLISKLHREFIDTIYVRKKMNMVGQYLAETIFLGNTVVRGTPIIPQMVALCPELAEYRVAPKNYTLHSENPLVIPAGTVLTEELCDYFEYIGRVSIKYKEKKTSKKVLNAYFEEEYVNNRHFPISDVRDVAAEHGIENENYIFVDYNGEVSAPSKELTCHDVAAMLSLYMKLLSGEHLDIIGDPDIGLRKTVEQCYDHFHKAFVYAVTVFKKSRGTAMKKLISDSDSKSQALNDVDRMNSFFKGFSNDFFRYLRSELNVLDILNTTNPVATISSLTKVNTMVKNAESVADSQRRLTMGHYGRICPYEMPQSKKLGVVNNLAISCTVEDGIMYTYYYKLYSSNGKIVLSDIPVKMTVVEEEKYRIADISNIEYDKKTGEVFNRGKVLARVPSTNELEKVTVASINIEDVQYVSISPNQHQSFACTTIPFAGADDAARVSFGLSMVKQTKGLVQGEIPIVCTTGFLNIPNLNTFYKIFAEKSGTVRVVNPNSITVVYNGDPDATTYKFDPMTISTESVIVRVPEVEVGERVKQGQTLVSSNFVQDGIMTTGVNALVAYMTDGYNYEDGATCSMRLSKKLTSYGVHIDNFPISKKSMSPSVTGVRYGDYLGKDDRLFVKRERVGNASEYSSTVMRSERCRGFIADYNLVRDNDYRRIEGISIRSVSFDPLTMSDKICNRHGNKGVSCRINDNSAMPYLENGEFIDVKYNPNGIVSRMNIGQTLEASLGLACYVLGIRSLCDSFNSPSIKHIKMLLSYAVDLANRDDMESVFSEYPELPTELHQHCRENISKIRRWRGTFDKDGKAYLIDPVSGKRTLNKVNIGVNYIYKLVQEGESKLHSRGGFMTSEYVAKTESPTKGASKGGGQRQGYMELDALAAYGASELLHEITNERSDNYIARNNFTVDALHSGEDRYKIDPSYGIRRSSEYMFEMFKALGLYLEFTEDEIRMDHPEERKYYKRSVLRKASFGDEEEEPDVNALTFMDFKNLAKRKK